MYIAFVPVRCGSKSIPLKNIKKIYGMPLVYWSLKALNECSKLNKIFVSTDCDKIANVVNSFNFSKVEIYYRDPRNSMDDSTTEECMLEFIINKNIPKEDFFVLVQATNPFLRNSDITNGIKLFEKDDIDSVLSVTEFKRFIWDQEGNAINYDPCKRLRRQDFKGNYLENGSFYINKVKNILEDKNRLSGKIGLYQMPDYSWVEMDEPIDWKIGEVLLKEFFTRNLESKIKDIKLLLFDVDGVFTDGSVFIGKQNESFLKFSRIDGKGIELLRERGYDIGVLSSEKSKIVKTRMDKLKINHVHLGIKNKLDVYEKMKNELGLRDKNICFCGDDVQDIMVLEKVGLSCCPKNSIDEVKNICDYVSDKKGGGGFVRDISNIFLKFRRPIMK